VEMTPIGWILLPLAITCYWLAPQALFPLAVFFLPFSATAVVNVGAADSASGVQASMLFGALWVLRELPTLGRLSSSQYKRLQTPIRQLGLFVVVVLLSWLVPLWINGHLVIESAELGDSGSAPLGFTARNVTQTLYLVYGILFTICVALRISYCREFVRSIRIFMVSAIFVSLWGFLQFICGLLNLEYPAFIFNTSKTESALGYTQELRDVGLKRISSVATEPSMFAQCMLIAAILALFMVISPRPLFSKSWDRVALVIVLGALLISTSTTAYLGLAGIFILYPSALFYLKILRAKHLVSIFVFAAILGIVYTVISPAQGIVQSMIVEKGESYSVLSRVYSVLLARDYFVQYPVLGLGWGSVTSHDLVFKLLSNTGIVGLFVFSLFVVTALVRLWRSARSGELGDSGNVFWSICILTSLLTIIVASAAGEFAFTYGHVWFVFGLAISVPVLSQASKGGQLDLWGFNGQKGAAR